VHLAEAIDSTVGKRAAVDVMLEVSPTRLREHQIGLYRSPNGVILARHVPAGAIVRGVPVTQRARRDASLLAWFPSRERPAPSRAHGADGDR
jgi:putative RNA 2'-phosphotransferase